MNLLRRTILSLVLVLLPSLAAAQHKVLHQVAGDDLLGGQRFELPAGADEVSIPFRKVNHHILVPVTVNGGGPFEVVLDTGMPVDGVILHGGGQVEALDLTYLDDVHVMIGGAGGEGNTKPARVAANLTLRIGDLVIRDASATILPTTPGFGAYFDGVIGAALFRHFAVTIDNDRSILTLRRPETYRPPEGAASVPLTIEGGMPFAETRVRVDESPAVPVRLVVDLGATHAVSLNEGDEPHIAAPATSIATAIGRGVSGELTGRIGRIRSLEIGGFTLAAVVATFPDQAHHSPRGMDSRNGNLGNGVLGRFNVTFDYAGGRMILQPGNRFAESFEWDMSGIQAEPTGEGTVRVRRVLPGSPAAAAGVKENDRILRIAGEEVTEEGYFSLRERLRKDGDTVSIELLRGEKPLAVSLKLRRLV